MLNDTLSKDGRALRCCTDITMVVTSITQTNHGSLLAKIKVFGVLSEHLPLILDAGTVLVSVPPLSCTGFVCCQCTGRWAVLDNTRSKSSGAFC